MKGKGIYDNCSLFARVTRALNILKSSKASVGKFPSFQQKEDSELHSGKPQQQLQRTAGSRSHIITTFVCFLIQNTHAIAKSKLSSRNNHSYNIEL